MTTQELETIRTEYLMFGGTVAWNSLDAADWLRRRVPQLFREIDTLGSDVRKAAMTADYSTLELRAEVNRLRTEAGTLRRLLASEHDRLRDEIASLTARAEDAEFVAVQRVGADPAVRDWMLHEFGTTDPELAAEGMEFRRQAHREAIAAEREACAQVADSHWDRFERDCSNHPAIACFREIANAIRARGQTGHLEGKPCHGGHTNPTA